MGTIHFTLLERLSPVGVMFCCGKVQEGGFNNLSRDLFV